jgi:cytochrome oxidase Cu insertion factor (SCO1/SenC/PrrC family)
VSSSPRDRASVTATSEAPIAQPPALLSPEARATAFATGKVPVDRAAALRSGTVPVPRKFIFWIVAGFAVLGLGGVLIEHLVGSAGVSAVVNTPPSTLAGTSLAAPPAPAAPSAPPVGASAAAFIGLTPLPGKPAPPLSLQQTNGTPWTLAVAAGKVTVVAFLNAECNDICPVLAKEITQADQLLGPRGSSVDFVVVNSDPLETSLTPPPPALTQTGLSSLANVTFLNGALPALNRVWSGYGVTVAVDGTTRVVTHSDVMDFIDPTGRLKSSATPFANEDRLGIFSLAPDSIQKFAQGIAQATESLLGGRS